MECFAGDCAGGIRTGQKGVRWSSSQTLNTLIGGFCGFLWYVVMIAAVSLLLLQIIGPFFTEPIPAQNEYNGFMVDNDGRIHDGEGITHGWIRGGNMYDPQWNVMYSVRGHRLVKKDFPGR